MKVKLNVKDKSVNTFLEERLLGFRSSDSQRMGEPNPYSMMKDEMFFKKCCDIEVGDIIKIDLFDRSEFSRKELVNKYTYKAEEYDDISIKMVLSDFEVINKSVPNKE